MTLYQHSGVSVESWIEMTSTVPMEYETDPENNSATLLFGQGRDYVMVLHRDNLAQMVSLASKAIASLDADRQV